MIEQFEVVQGYRQDENLRNSFDELATDTFGISFKDWYKNGEWQEVTQY